MLIRKIEKGDKQAVIEMMRVFYASDAVSSNGSNEIFEADVQTCIDNSPYLEGYVFCEKDDIIGYAMLAKSFSTEWGKECVWIEDIFVKEEYRGRGIAKEFFALVDKKYPLSVQRLEVEDYNLSAVKAYQKSGFNFVPYKEMWKNLK